ncbi:caspase, EACC1-associated type [Streptomyces sp. NRRL S-337]|uniref:caspase, EACC1-associated type n=1 Tax=Streptomyces sp. NRRL S-337 TaxID=1463900 RepID=UPI000690FFB6|nr:caspase family protein [Streptomyces sp. NRRL S-337]
MALPDPRASRAVLIGVHDYRQLDPLPGVQLGARRLAQLLRDPRVWGLPRRNVTLLHAQASANELLEAVRDAGEAATDTLIVYFAGHGLRDRGAEQLYLALADADDEHLEIGTLEYPSLRRVITGAGRRASRRITVLDCCYSGLAISMGGDVSVVDRPSLARLLDEQEDEDDDVGDQGDYGSCVLTSAARTEPSFTPPGRYPDFTGELIHVLEQGIHGAGPTLSIDDIWRRVRLRLHRRGRPLPQQFGHNAAATRAWVRNRAHHPPGPEPTTKPAAPPVATTSAPPAAERPSQAPARSWTPEPRHPESPGQGQSREVAPATADRGNPKRPASTTAWPRPGRRSGNASPRPILRRRTFVMVGAVITALGGMSAGILATRDESRGDDDPTDMSGPETTSQTPTSPQPTPSTRSAPEVQAFDALTGHPDTVSSVAFSPDGKLLATSSRDTLRLWHVGTREQFGKPLTDPTGVISSVAFSPDGELIASSSFGQVVQLWDVSTRTQGKPLIGYAEAVLSVAFSPDGKLLATSSAKGEASASAYAASIWDVATRKQLGKPLTGHALFVWSVAFSPNGKVLATGSNDKTVLLWDVTTHNQLGKPLTGHVGAVSSVVFSPDGKVLATSSWDGTARLWDVTTHKRLGKPLTGHTGSVLSVAFSPDGKVLATGGKDKTVLLWDVTTHKQLGKPLTGHTGSVLSVAFSPDGKLLATSSADRTVRLWQLE